MTARKMVNIRQDTYSKATRVQKALAERVGRPVSLADVLDRAVEALDDAHQRGAWLSPKEAGPVIEERQRMDLVTVITQVARHFDPSERPSVGFRELTAEVNIRFLNRDELWLVRGSGQDIRIDGVELATRPRFQAEAPKVST